MPPSFLREEIRGMKILRMMVLLAVMVVFLLTSCSSQPDQWTRETLGILEALRRTDGGYAYLDTNWATGLPSLQQTAYVYSSGISLRQDYIDSLKGVLAQAITDANDRSDLEQQFAISQILESVPAGVQKELPMFKVSPINIEGRQEDQLARYYLLLSRTGDAATGQVWAHKWFANNAVTRRNILLANILLSIPGANQKLQVDWVDLRAYLQESLGKVQAGPEANLPVVRSVIEFADKTGNLDGLETILAEHMKEILALTGNLAVRALSDQFWILQRMGRDTANVEISIRQQQVNGLFLSLDTHSSPGPTFEAASIRAFLGDEVSSDPRFNDWMTNFTPSAFPHAYYLARCQKLYGFDGVDYGPATSILADIPNELTPANLYTLAAILEMLPTDFQISDSVTKSVTDVINQILREGIQPTSEYLLCLKIISDKLKLGTEELSNYLVNQAKSMQSNQGGFAAEPGDEPDVYSTYACVRILCELRASFDKSKAYQWLMQRRLNTGGFREVEGKPIFSLSSTYYALSAIKILGN